MDENPQNSEPTDVSATRRGFIKKSGIHCSSPVSLRESGKDQGCKS